VRNGHPIFVMDVPSAEMVKYASNAMLACKISFINEIANLCESYGANVSRVREGMCADRRIGNQFLYPGLGYGGSCFPKDTLAVIAMGEHVGRPSILNKAVHEVNQRQRDVFFGKVAKHFGGAENLRGKKMAVWGIAFKPRTDDIREAPALTLMRKGLEAGMRVSAFDPVANENARREFNGHSGPEGGLTIADGMYDAVEGADLLVVCTDWDEFKSPDFDRVRRAMRSPVVFDGRNLYRLAQMAAMKFSYYSVGRAPVVMS
jgi:UDPglucose 6-dehydrogenase